MLQFGVSLNDDASSFNYNHNMFIIQATGLQKTKIHDGLPLKCQLAMERQYSSLKKLFLQVENLAFSDQWPVL